VLQAAVICNIYYQKADFVTNDHRTKKARHPVRSALFKLSIGCVVVGWVTTSEFQLLFVKHNFAYFGSFCDRYSVNKS
jgi:hypothetical protein